MSKFTGIRLYSRLSNKWSNFLKLKAGFDASFVLDKTTDSANISLIVKDMPSFLKINMWVALFINADSTELEFNADGTPKNHEQFIVGGYQYFSSMGGYEISMKIVEPIERFRGILGETLSFTNQTSKTQNGITETRPAYNYYTVLKRWLQVTPANTDNISRDSDNKDPDGIAWWNRITILDKDFLSSLPFADDTFNELSLYDLLLNVYDSGTGRTPVAYFDIDSATGLPRNMKRDEYLLKFIKQDGTDKPIIDWSFLTENKGHGEVLAGLMKREDGANYATGLVANVTNLSPSTTVTFPAQSVYASPEVMAEVRNTTDYDEGKKSKSYWGVVAPHKIKKIKRAEEYEFEGSDGVILSWDVEQRKVLERKQRDATIKETAWSDVDIYDEGDNNYYAESYAYVDNPITAALYSFEYEPLVDARICVGDSEFVQQINQTASQVDSDKFGKFMENYLAGMGKADFTVQRTTEHPEEYINLIGSKVRKDGKMFMITNVALRNRNFQYDVFFQLNENHTRKNMMYQAPQNIRANTAIQYDNIKNRKTNISEKMIVRLEGEQGEKIKYLNSSARKAVMNALLPHSIFQDIRPDISQDFYPQFSNITIHQHEEDDDILDYEQRSTNIASFVFGNQICVNVKFLNNAIAGKRKIFKSGAGEYGRVSEQIPILYTDKWGEVNKTSIDIISVKPASLDDPIKVVDTAASVYGAWLKAKQKIISIPKINLQKDMLEEYNITYSLEVTGRDRIKVLPDLLKYSRILNQTAVADKLHAIAYDDYDGQGNVIGENDLGDDKVRLLSDSALSISRTIEHPIDNQNAKSLLLQSKIGDKTIDCLLINNDGYKYNLIDNLTILF